MIEFGTDWDERSRESSRKAMVGHRRKVTEGKLDGGSHTCVGNSWSGSRAACFILVLSGSSGC